jgi:hypothetical protein
LSSLLNSGGEVLENIGGFENSQPPATQPNGTGDRQIMVKDSRQNHLKITEKTVNLHNYLSL